MDTTRDSIDIKDVLDGPVAEVIERLQELQRSHPNGTIDVSTDFEYGEPYAAARLNFVRDRTPLEVELGEWREKADRLNAMQREVVAFDANETPYPREAEMEELRKELGFFAMAPTRGTLTIFNGEILVVDMARGGRRRDGAFAFKTMMPASPELDAMFAAADARYA